MINICCLVFVFICFLSSSLSLGCFKGGYSYGGQGSSVRGHKKLWWDRQTWEVETTSGTAPRTNTTSETHSETAPFKLTPQPTSLSSQDAIEVRFVWYDFDPSISRQVTADNTYVMGVYQYVGPKSGVLFKRWWFGYVWSWLTILLWLVSLTIVLVLTSDHPAVTGESDYSVTVAPLLPLHPLSPWESTLSSSSSEVCPLWMWSYKRAFLWSVGQWSCIHVFLEKGVAPCHSTLCPPGNPPSPPPQKCVINKEIGDAGSTADIKMLWSALVCPGLLWSATLPFVPLGIRLLLLLRSVSLTIIRRVFFATYLDHSAVTGEPLHSTPATLPFVPLGIHLLLLLFRSVSVLIILIREFPADLEC